MKKTPLLLIFTFFLFIGLTNAQNLASDYETDYIVDLKGIQLRCKITKIKNGNVQYRLYKKFSPVIVNLMNLNDIYLNDKSEVPNNWVNSLEKPIDGFSHVYIYSTLLHSRVFYNGNKLATIRRGSYFLHKIKIGKKHIYYIKGNKDDEKIKLTPKSGEIFFIHPMYNENAINVMVGVNFMTTNGIRLNVKNDKISEYAVLSIKKRIESK